MLGFGPTSELVRFLVDIGRSWHVCCFVCQNLYLFVLITLIQKFYETTDHVMLCDVYTTRKLTVEDPKRSHYGAVTRIRSRWLLFVFRC